MAGSSNPRLRFHAVSVLAGAHACPAVLALKDVRLLSLAAPKLPLANCDNPAACDCRFKHYDDRRAGPRRTTEINESARRPVVTVDRRDRRGRRASDYDEEF